MNFVIRFNWILIGLGAFLLYFEFGSISSVESGTPHFLMIDLIAVSGLALLQLVFLLKLRQFYGFSLVLLYTIALLVGLRIMLSVGQLLSFSGILFFILELFVIFYLIGVRGFLKSNKGRAAFGLEPNPSQGGEQRTDVS
ncbi:hypothetical protein [Pleionea sediminis]|uniref:hypothetical protein n=1 Tax=Pleionea sediminis TaxID=2569479 RepID=UPI00118551A4|nr:hypothetical protein [Pleionea sediminis]